MYPIVRHLLAVGAARLAPALGLFEPHVSRHTCLPWDLDPWWELNNGRTLTLYDLGRIPLVMRTGIYRTLGEAGWSLTVAGSSVRYRRRIRLLDRVTMFSQVLGWDQRFIYIEQSLWQGRECANQVLIRTAFTSDQGIVAPALVMARLGHDAASPALPEWVNAWIAADALRPWPPAAGDHLPS